MRRKCGMGYGRGGGSVRARCVHRCTLARHPLRSCPQHATRCACDATALAMSGEWSMLEQEWQPSYRPLPPRPSAPYTATNSRCAPNDNNYQYYTEASPTLPPYYQMPAPQLPMPPPPPPPLPLPLQLPPSSHAISPPELVIPQFVPQNATTVSAFPRGYVNSLKCLRSVAGDIATYLHIPICPA